MYLFFTQPVTSSPLEEVQVIRNATFTLSDSGSPSDLNDNNGICNLVHVNRGLECDIESLLLLSVPLSFVSYLCTIKGDVHSLTSLLLAVYNWYHAMNHRFQVLDSSCIHIHPS